MITGSATFPLPSFLPLRFIFVFVLSHPDPTRTDKLQPVEKFWYTLMEKQPFFYFNKNC